MPTYRANVRAAHVSTKRKACARQSRTQAENNLKRAHSTGLAHTSIACRMLLDDNSRHGFSSPENNGGRNRHQHHRFGGIFTFASWRDHDQWSGHVGRLRACRFRCTGLLTRIALATTFSSVVAGISLPYNGIMP